MAKFHLNPAKGPLPCSAEPGACPYGAEAPHFATYEEARGAYEQAMATETNHMAPATRAAAPAAGLSVAQTQYIDLMLDRFTDQQLNEEINKSPEHYRHFEKLVTERSQAAFSRAYAIENLRRADSPVIISEGALAANERDLALARNRTADIVNILDASRFRDQTPSSLKWLPNADTVGQSLRVPSNVEFSSAFRAGVVAPEEAVTALVGPPARPPLDVTGHNYRQSVFSPTMVKDFAKAYPQSKVEYALGTYQRMDRPWQASHITAMVTERDGSRGVLIPINVDRLETWSTKVPPRGELAALYTADTVQADFALVSAYYDQKHLGDYRFDATYPVGPDHKPMSAYTAAWASGDVLSDIKGWRKTA